MSSMSLAERVEDLARNLDTSVLESRSPVCGVHITGSTEINDDSGHYTVRP